MISSDIAMSETTLIKELNKWRIVSLILVLDKRLQSQLDNIIQSISKGNGPEDG